jgi:hypothetical protein
MDGTGVSMPTGQGTDAGGPAAHRLSLAAQVWHFARHYLEMCAAMCIGGVILNALVFVVGPALIGYPDLRQQAPGLALAVDAFLFTLPMAAWMRIRGMAWRPTLEMSGATVGVAIGSLCTPDAPATRWDTTRTCTRRDARRLAGGGPP